MFAKNSFTIKKEKAAEGFMYCERAAAVSFWLLSVFTTTQMMSWAGMLVIYCVLLRGCVCVYVPPQASLFLHWLLQAI